jgi:catechol-2,3-dioxygenase
LGGRKKRRSCHSFASKLEKNKIEVHQGKTSFADKRFVEDLIYFDDPQGNRIELSL